MRFIISAYLLLGLIYSVVTPIFEAPDEPQHFFFVREIVEQRGLPMQRSGISERWYQEGSQPPLYYVLGAALTFWTDASDWREFVERNPYAVQGNPQALGNKNVFLRSAREEFPWRGTALAAHALRIVSLAIGALGVMVTYQLARLLFPNRPAVALGAAAIHAFLPQFLFVSAAVNNDVLAVLTCGLVVWQAVRVAQGAASRRDDLLLGFLVGLAALSKLSGAAMALVAVGAVVMGVFAPATRSGGGWVGVTLRRILLIALVTFAIAGWWYARNLLLYGDVTGLNRMLAIVGTRNPPPDLWQLLDETEGLRLSFWGVFGWFNILMPQALYAFYDGLAIIALLGLVIAIGRKTNNERRYVETSRRGVFARPLSLALRLASAFSLQPSALLVLAFGLVLVGVLRWGVLTPGLQGRLLFPALSAIAVMLSAGLAAWLFSIERFGVKQLTQVLSAYPLVYLLIALLVPLQIIAPAYARPELVTPHDTAPLVRWAGRDQIELLNVEAPATSVHPGDELALTLRWLTREPIARPYTLFIKVFGAEDELLATADTYPGFGTFPTTQWPANQAIVDRYRLRVSPTARVPTYAQVVVGFYERAASQAMTPTNRDGQRIVRPVVARVKVTTAKPIAAAPTRALDANFGDQIVLRGYDLSATGITLYWQARQPPTEDYTVFVHALDRDGQLLAQSDSPPRHGAYPTSVWERGEQVPDEHALIWPPRAARIAIGLYALQTGARLPLVGQSGDAVVIEMAP